MNETARENVQEITESRSKTTFTNKSRNAIRGSEENIKAQPPSWEEKTSTSTGTTYFYSTAKGKSQFQVSG